MQAIIQTNYGPPDVLVVKEVDKPTPKDTEILVKVYTTTANRTDCAMLRAKPVIMRLFTGLFGPKKPSLGTDFAGIVESIGEKVTKFKPGDRVFGFDDNGICSHAQYFVTKETNAIEMVPEDSSFEECVALAEGVHYAVNFLNKVTLKKGDSVLVNGATGAIGNATLQLAVYYGATVTAVCRGEHADLVKSLGASSIIDYTQEEFSKTKEKFHCIFDAVGKSTFSKCKPLLHSGGVYSSSELGPYAQNPFLALFSLFIGNKKVTFPFPYDRPTSMQLVKKLLQTSKIKPVIDKTYPMEQIQEAFTYVETGQKVGAVLISFNQNKMA